MKNKCWLKLHVVSNTLKITCNQNLEVFIVYGYVDAFFIIE